MVLLPAMILFLLLFLLLLLWVLYRCFGPGTKAWRFIRRVLGIYEKDDNH